MLKGLPCGISPQSLFALKFACLKPSIPSKVSGIFPVSLLMDTSSHWIFSSRPNPVGMVPVIWFLEMSSFCSSIRSEIEFGMWPVIWFPAMLRDFKLRPSLNSGMLPEI